MIPLPPLAAIHSLAGSRGVFRTTAPHVALTFDDGPHPERTQAVMEVLARHGARATFFVVGERAERQPELVRRIAQAGHAIANHGWAHRWQPWLSRRQLEDDIDRSQRLLTELAGVPPRFIRPAYGWTGSRFDAVAAERRLTPVFWSRDTWDWTGAPTALVLRRTRGASSGDIILFHDGAPQARGTLGALDAWLRDGAPPVGPLTPA